MASGRSSAIASATAPEPVATSTTTGAATGASSSSTVCTRISVSGRGTNTPGRTRTTIRRKPCSPVTCWSGSPTHRRQSARPKRFASCDVSPSRA